MFPARVQMSAVMNFKTNVLSDDFFFFIISIVYDTVIFKSYTSIHPFCGSSFIELAIERFKMKKIKDDDKYKAKRKPSQFCQTFYIDAVQVDDLITYIEMVRSHFRCCASVFVG